MPQERSVCASRVAERFFAIVQLLNYVCLLPSDPQLQFSELKIHVS